MKTLLIILNSFIIIASVGSQSTWDEIKNAANSIGQVVSGTGCLALVSPQITNECLSAFDKEVESRPKDERNNKVCHSIDLDFL